MGASEPAARIKIPLTVPKRVAAEAASRAAGNAAAPSPVLMLEDVEVGAGEGLSILVLGPPEPGTSRPGPMLGVASTVGRPQKVPAAPLRHMTLAVPLNDQGSRLLAGKSQVNLVLELDNSPGRTPLKFKRAYFDTGEPGGQAPPR